MPHHVPTRNSIDIRLNLASNQALRFGAGHYGYGAPHEQIKLMDQRDGRRSTLHIRGHHHGEDIGNIDYIVLGGDFDEKISFLEKENKRLLMQQDNLKNTLKTRDQDVERLEREAERLNGTRQELSSKNAQIRALNNEIYTLKEQYGLEPSLRHSDTTESVVRQKRSHSRRRSSTPHPSS